MQTEFPSLLPSEAVELQLDFLFEISALHQEVAQLDLNLNELVSSK